MSSRFQIRSTPLAGLHRVERLPIGDQRGFLERLYCMEEFRELGLHAPIAQINRTLTSIAGTVRGMHLQLPPHSETKFVSCLQGEVFDVAVDLRAGSATFLHWHAEVLTCANHASLLIPAGFAHGFQTLTADCEMLYLHTAAHAPGAESAVSPLDPRLGIAWPRPIGPMSERDSGHPLLAADFPGFRL